eukprot:12905656-Prorocentrum_lima.AAC.1
MVHARLTKRRVCAEELFAELLTWSSGMNVGLLLLPSRTEDPSTMEESGTEQEQQPQFEPTGA